MDLKYVWYCQVTGTATRRVSRTCATTSPPAPGEPANGNTASGHVTQSSPLIGCSRDTAGISSLPPTDPATLLVASFKVTTEYSC